MQSRDGRRRPDRYPRRSIGPLTQLTTTIDIQAPRPDWTAQDVLIASGLTPWTLAALPQRPPLADDPDVTARIVLRVDEHGRCIYSDINRAGVDYFGLSCGEVLGRSPREVFFPDIARELDTLHRRCIESRQPLRYQRTRPFKSGRRTFGVEMIPVIEGARVTAIEVIAHDITRCQQAA